MGSAGASPRPLLNWVLAYLAAIYPTQNLRKPLRLESTHRAAGPDRPQRGGGIEIEQTTGGAVDVLVNNAGGVAEQEMRPIEEVPDADWDRVFAVNIGAAFALSRAVAAGMKRAGSGRIVNISSGAGLGPSLTGIQAYCSARHAVVGLTRQLAHELGPFGITVNSVAPVSSAPTRHLKGSGLGTEMKGKRGWFSGSQ